MCEQVSVGVCDWGWFAPAESHHRWAISVPVTLSPLSDPCSVAVVVYGPFWFRDSWALLLPGLRSPDLWLPIASLRYPRLPYGKLRFCLRKAPPLPYGKLRFCLRKAPPLSTKSSTFSSRCVLLLVINSLFRNWILPSSLWQFFCNANHVTL